MELQKSLQNEFDLDKVILDKQSTPMIEQYLEIKAQHKDCLLFFRMGDFFELFFDDAKEASKILDIALTSRGKHLGEKIPMCGVPHHAADFYISKLVKANKKIAICEQTESPQEARKRGGYKAVVKREVIRVITAGTLIEDELIGESVNNFLSAIVPSKRSTQGSVTFAVSVIDISTGDFFSEEVQECKLLDTVLKYRPSEIIVPDWFFVSSCLNDIKTVCPNVSRLPDSRFNPTIESERIKEMFGVNFLSGIDDFSKTELTAMGALASYISNTQKTDIRLNLPKRIKASNYLEMKSDTVRNLEIWKSGNGSNETSLFSTIDETCSPMGKRLLMSRLTFPINSIIALESRLDSVEFFQNNKELLLKVRAKLKNCTDIERAINRIKFLKGTPKDVLSIKNTLSVYEDVLYLLADFSLQGELKTYLLDAAHFHDLIDELTNSINDEIQSNSKISDCIKFGYNSQLDEIKNLKKNAENTITDLQNHYITETDISTLRIKKNNLIGWFVEIPVSQKAKIPEEFIWKQTISNNIRYTTLELDELQQSVLSADVQIAAIELEIFNAILKKITKLSDEISTAAKVLAVIDVSSSFAYLATNRQYSRPTLSSSVIFDISEGRHPVVEHIKESGRSTNFVANDCILDERQNISIVTGPNMAGKSTYLRQNATIVLLAHIGCFVPTKNAVIGVVDKLFSRIGASDDLAYGKSTFMVEMLETAAILNQATEKSFVILDEVGRGTATFDGLSIAFAVVEYLSKRNKCRTLFATHYHELSKVKDSLPNVKFQTLKIQEWGSSIIFDHKVIYGIADKSYGIHVAKLAGVPVEVLDRANEILIELEASNKGKNFYPQEKTTPTAIVDNTAERLRNSINETDIDSLSPRQALDFLYNLKQMINKDSKIP